MCIDCARRFVDRLDLQSSTCPPSGSWYISVIDHTDHVHVRIDNASGANEWVQVSARHEDLLCVLDEQDIPYFIHLDENSGGGCSEAVIDALHQETVNPDRAEQSAADGDTCAVCCDCFNLGDEVVSLPCSHRYHVACIKPWLRRKASCPTCRSTITRSAVGLPNEPSTPVVESPMLRHTTRTPERVSPQSNRTIYPQARRSAIRRLGSWVATHSSLRHSTQTNDGASLPRAYQNSAPA